MLDRLASMEAFIRAADLGSFTAAGVALGISSQMVGKHVSAQEVRLGAVRLHRTTRRMHLTELGQRYYESCRAVLAAAEAADSLAEEVGAAPAGPTPRQRVAVAVGGHGIILQPEAVVAEALSSGALARTHRLCGARAPDMLLHASREPMPAKLRIFIDHVTDALSTQR